MNTCLGLFHRAPKLMSPDDPIATEYMSMYICKKYQPNTNHRRESGAFVHSVCVM